MKYDVSVVNQFIKEDVEFSYNIWYFIDFLSELIDGGSKLIFLLVPGQNKYIKLLRKNLKKLCEDYFKWDESKYPTPHDLYAAINGVGSKIPFYEDYVNLNQIEGVDDGLINQLWVGVIKGLELIKKDILTQGRHGFNIESLE